jgi:5-methylcytosine-specific restriction enzyme subunit McrC
MSGSQGMRRRIELGPVRERDRLTFSLVDDWQRLHLVGRTVDLPEGFLTLGRGRTLRVGGYVGLLDTGTIRLEILPRTSITGSPASDRQFLIDLLSELSILPRPRQRQANVSMTGRRLLEVVIRATAARIVELLAEGPPRRYYPTSEWASTIRGRLDLRQLAGRLPTAAHWFPIRHTPLQRENALSLLLAALCQAFMAASRDLQSRRLLSQALDRLAMPAGSGLTHALVDRVHLLPHEQVWAPFLALAAALLRGRAPNPVEAGEVTGLGLIFSMHDLFERLLRQKLQALTAKIGHSLSTSNSRYLLREDGTGRLHVNLRPDFVVQDRRRTTLVVADAKWKLQGSAVGLKVERADAYQMTAYMLRHQSSEGLLLYPGLDGVERVESSRLVPSGGRLTLATVNVGGLVSRSATERAQAEDWLISLLNRYVSGGRLDER